MHRSVLTAVAALGLGLLTAPAASATNINANDFSKSTTIDNPYLPYSPGTVFNYRGQEDGDPATDTVTVTNKTKDIAGVTNRVVHDEVAIKGKVQEKTDDYFAQDNQGNVWYFGEDSFERKGSKFVRADDSWLTGVDGAKPGIMMEANPKVGDTYKQEDAPNAQDRAKVLSLNESVTVPYGSFDNVLETEETTPLEPGVVDHKYYARNVGEIKELTVQGGSDLYELVSVSH